MKKLIAGVTMVALVAFAGCNDHGTSGGPGTANPSSKNSSFTQAEDTFSLSVPTFSTTLKQGESKTVTISIKRGKNFDEDVNLGFTTVPKGVTIDPGSPMIKRADTDSKITIKAADDAAVGEFTVKVTGHPSRGTDATNDFKVTVEKK